MFWDSTPSSPTRNNAPLRLLAITTAAATLCCAATTATAQDKGAFVELSAGQKMLINEGAKASNEGDFEKAIRLLKVSIDLGPINVTYLNLGRALQKNNQCDEARHAYDKALLAPKVSFPAPDKVSDFITKYRQELGKTCPGTLVVTCEPAKATLRIDGGNARTCNSAPISLKPGKHTIKGEFSGTTVLREVTVKAFEPSFIRLSIKQPVVTDAREQFRVAQGLLKSGKTERARTKFLEAHTTAPHWGPPLFELGQVALRNNDYIDAIKWFERHRPYAQPSDLPNLDKLVARAEQRLDALLKTRAQAKPAKKSDDRDKASSNK